MNKQLSASKQNGRSTSQVSIYDYPEHLNPFYEDDNHKRLRFWKIGTVKKEKSGRSNSFSLDGLKDMWAFKSFRLRKKSSTLGINKTSESPPTLRREMEPSQSYNSGTALRHTVNIGLGNNFDRNTPYRSSLQDVNNHGNRYNNNTATLGFNRNDRYRNTMQNAGGGGGYQTTPRSLNRYGGSGMNNTTIGLVTTPTTAQRYTNSSRPITRGSSQTSLNSTNPFDDDYDDGDTMSTIGSIADGSESVRRTGRKKRRAHAPPTPKSASSTMTNNNNNNNDNNQNEQPLATSSPSVTIRNNNNSQNSITNQEGIRETTLIDRRRTSPLLRNNDEDVDDRQNENNEIHNLTAEIESFVKIADTDTEQLTNTTKISTADDKPIAAERKIKKIDKNNPIIATDLSSESESPDRIITSSTTNTRTIIEHRKSPENNEEYSDNTRENSPDNNTINNKNNNNNNNIYKNNNNNNNNDDVQSRISPDKLVNLDDQNHSDRNMKKSPIKIIIRRATEEDVMIDKNKEQESSAPSHPSKSDSVEKPSINNLPNKIVQTGETTTTTTTTPTTVIQVNEVKPELPVEVIIKSENQEKLYTTKKRSPPPAIPNGKQSKKIDDINEAATDMLKITESNDDLTKIDHSPASPTSIGTTSTTTTITNQPTCSITNLEYAAEKYRIRYVPLKNFSPEPLRRDRYTNNNTKENNGFNYVEQQRVNDSKESSPQPIVPERRRSVKDIIASINKCQSLLKINQQPQQSSTENGIINEKRFTSLDTINTSTSRTSTKPQSLTFESSQPLQITTPSNESITRNINQLNESEREIKRLISEMEEQHSPTSKTATAMDIDSSLPLMVEKFDEYNQSNNNDNNELFKKCIVQKREKKNSKQLNIDGIDEYDQMQTKTNPSSHLEWNPLPKPRRSRNSNEFGKI